ncbi:hypothetical protein Rhsp01_57770 [Rhizobium sp. NBRC 114257]|uniref:Uncharacterized protein n=1 Tax=Rhizobium dioscoreae TaxID=2653122 RepID=A0ABQ0ZD79_9HYPH|nr:hypothetical protein RsS93_57720 [Rhizobium dioscoreae]GLU84601.1 hypothetical protein Rhsp01_57770 [Rhizobium sp. NBRC 114257]
MQKMSVLSLQRYVGWPTRLRTIGNWRHITQESWTRCAEILFTAAAYWAGFRRSRSHDPEPSDEIENPPSVAGQVTSYMSD